ncbi:hypothetical protein LXJ58_34695, partial [Escherichia coli]|nr:hypothetical protein [Escherichia coli]
RLVTIEGRLRAIAPAVSILRDTCGTVILCSYGADDQLVLSLTKIGMRQYGMALSIQALTQ